MQDPDVLRLMQSGRYHESVMQFAQLTRYAGLPFITALRNRALNTDRVFRRILGPFDQTHLDYLERAYDQLWSRYQRYMDKLRVGSLTREKYDRYFSILRSQWEHWHSTQGLTNELLQQVEDHVQEQLQLYRDQADALQTDDLEITEKMRAAV